MTILNQTPIIEMSESWELAIAILLIIGIFSFLCFLLTGMLSWDTGMIVTGGSAIICLVVALILALAAPEVETGRNEYEAIIDETVPIVEVYEKYEVVERRGDIWVLEDKEINE